MESLSKQYKFNVIATVKSVLLVLTFSLVIGIGAWVRIPLPFTPVPFTLQVFSILLIANFRKWEGVFASVLYVGLGAVGLPVFASFSGGLGHIAGPTGGYILGFPLAVITMRYLFDDREDFLSVLLRNLLGITVIYIIGVLHLTLLYTHSITNSLMIGIYPFIIGDVLKALVVVGIWKSICGYIFNRLPDK